MEDETISEEVAQWVRFCGVFFRGDRYWKHSGIPDAATDLKAFKEACSRNDPAALAKLKRFVKWKMTR